MDRLNSLISKINSLNLDTDQYIEIYKILKKDTVKITKNNNGVFINLINISDNAKKELDNFILYIDSQEINN
jgi:hypothetical protein|tara:strand:+ start:44 stop:259 length:216 start_codon:yes stop_codon:yes gene_type:complete